jgi:AcrR family transcriptional regulator
VRSSVLTAALEELAAVGFAAFSVDGVAARAGVHKTTVYRRWRTRENLLLEAMLERGREHVPIPDTGSLRSDLLAYGRAIVASLRTPESEAAVRAVASIGDRGSAIAKASRAFWSARFELTGEIVARAVARNEIPAGVDPQIVVEAVVAPIYFRLLLNADELDPRFLARVADFAAAAAGAPDPG